MARKYEFKPDKPRSGLLNKLYLTQKQRKTFLKWLLYSLFLLVLSVLQDVIFCRLRIFGASTDLVPCGILLICILEGMERSSIFCLIASLLYLFSGTAPGAYCVVLITFLAMFTGYLRQSYLQRGFRTTMLCMVVMMLLYELVVFGITLFLQLTVFARIGAACLTGLYSALAAAILYPVVQAIGTIGGETWKE